jgi:hypothetical protein
MSALLQRVEGVVPCLTKPSFSRHPNPKFQHSPRILHAAFCSVYYKILLSVHLQACISGDISDKHTLSKAPPPHPRFSSDNPSYRYQPLRFCLSAIPTCRYLPLLDIAIHALHNARYQKCIGAPGSRSCSSRHGRPNNCRRRGGQPLALRLNPLQGLQAFTPLYNSGQQWKGELYE